MAKQIKINMDSVIGREEDVRTFVQMCAWLESCGNVGHSCEFKVRFDGDGAARLRFNFGKDQEAYEKLKHWLVTECEKDGDIERFIFE